MSFSIDFQLSKLVSELRVRLKNRYYIKIISLNRPTKTMSLYTLLFSAACQRIINKIFSNWFSNSRLVLLPKQMDFKTFEEIVIP